MESELSRFTLQEVLNAAITRAQCAAHQNSAAHGFWEWYEKHKDDPESVTIWKLSRMALIHSEASEATEGVRKDLMDDHLPELSMEVCELADVVIRILDYAGGHHLPLGHAINAKMAYNETRPYKHGKRA